MAVSEATAARSGRSCRVSPTAPLIRRSKRRSIVPNGAYVASASCSVNGCAPQGHAFDSFPLAPLNGTLAVPVFRFEIKCDVAVLVSVLRAALAEFG